VRVNSEEIVVRWERADADAQLVPPLGHVIEIRDPVSQFDGVMIRQQVAERAESDPLGSLECLGDQQVRRGARFPGSGKMFADPGLLKSERVESIKFLQV
jgi:hypothetical protein